MQQILKPIHFKLVLSYYDPHAPFSLGLTWIGLWDRIQFGYLWQYDGLSYND